MKLISLLWYILKTLMYIALGVLYFILTCAVVLFSKWKAKALFQHYLRIYFWMMRVNIEFSFSDEKQRQTGNSVLVLLNQMSFLDSMVTPLIPTPKTLGILNIELGLYPVLGWFYLLMNYVIVRQWSAQAKRTLNRTNAFLKSGGNMIISIEGKRSKDGHLNAYKKGPVVMAINAQADIIPFVIEGTYEILPYGSLYCKSGKVKVKFLESISTKGKTYDDRNALICELEKVAKDCGLG